MTKFQSSLRFHWDKIMTTAPPGRTNVLIKFHKDCIIIVTSKECHASLQPYIISTNILTKFHRHWTTNVTSSVITKKTGLPPGSHVFQQTRTIFKLIRDMFHENWTINVTSRVLKRNCHDHWRPLLTSHVFQPTGTIFELVQHIIRTNVLTKFHENGTINLTSTVKTAPPPGGHVFLPTGIIFELVKDFIGTHVPTKFHDDWTNNVTSRVLTRKTTTPPGTQVYINGTHVLTKFHEDWTINVNVDAARQTTHKRRSQKLTMSTLCSDQHTNQPTNRQGKNNMSPTTIIWLRTQKYRTDGQLDGRTTPKQYPSASGGG
ncbi:hypothetical protein DPMN_160105 [Dreissena polymorpha]|uniref:Uncharacterized protein n=1 Tax=Dreissena polymorpha TaxID=45954 RepID=A0A9D4IS89_DREPO|nr:hypothetical protein DPMN_160105 [Dreissena polymorpha]